MGLFSGIKKARGTAGGNYLVPGKFLLRIDRCKQGETRDRDDFFVAEFTIIESDEDSLPAGRTASFFVKFGKYPELSLGNVADFMRCAIASSLKMRGEDYPEDVDEVDLDEETADAVSGEENILAGTYIRCEAYNKPTKEGKDFTRHKWFVPSDADLKKHL